MLVKRKRGTVDRQLVTTVKLITGRKRGEKPLGFQ
jgi:hypothetical protein